MKSFFTAFILLFLIIDSVNGQTKVSVPTTEPYGIIDTADLKMTSCDFEKDAGAEVLFDKAVVTYEYTSIVMQRHKRIKIFNDNGKKEANIRIEFLGKNRDEVIKDIEAETINLNNKSVEYVSVDEKLIYTESIDKYRKAIVFTFPNVKAGSVIEFNYSLITPYPYNYPDWFFNSSIPTRYSEFDGSFDKNYLIDGYRRVYQQMSKDTTIAIDFSTGSKRIWAMTNVQSYHDEPYMGYPEDYQQCLLFKPHHVLTTWATVVNGLLFDEDFGQQLDSRLSNKDIIISTTKAIKTTDEKTAYIFNTVKKSIKWDKSNRWFTVGGIKKAWDKKIGNSTEINLILYNLLKSANLSPRLLVLSTRDHGRINPNYPSATNFNKTVLYYPIDSTKYYVLDASNPYNTFDNIPVDLSGLNAFSIDADSKKFVMFQIKNATENKAVQIEGEISENGKLEGNVNISTSAYGREKFLKTYESLGEKDYVNQMQRENSDMTITSLKIENAENDTLPLIENFEFKHELAEPDGGYLYFNTNIFSGFKTNPFFSEARISDIDFGCLYNYTINGRYKIPPGYKTVILPKSIKVRMPDDGIIFRRFVFEENGIISIRYIVNYKKSHFPKEEYQAIHDFYKKMFELFNEQVVLKKI
ncbi:MAG TPA: DUF3857 domain-containing protein [Mucilaginibacter sp.]|jgi:hypothetical protein